MVERVEHVALENLDFLSGKDKSPQGLVDGDIVELLRLLYSAGYLTTSSCSGRVTLMRGVKKGSSEWIYKDHFHGDFERIWEIVSELSDGEHLRFLFEPFIIHVKCGSLEKAEVLLSELHVHGLKKSSLISFNDFIIEILDTGRMETLVDSSLSRGYVEGLVAEANRRLEKTKKRIRELEIILSKQGEVA